MNPPNINNGGLTYIPAISTGELFINNQRFRDIVAELIAEDTLEQGEIDEIKLLLQYLNTSGLSSEWIIDNNNKNQDLKNAITLIQTKLANIDTTALTESSVLTNDNRNSVLKTAIDTAATDLTTLTSRVTTAEGDIDNLETRMTTAEGDIDGVETRMTTAEGDIGNLKTRMTTAEGDIDGVETKTRFITEATVVGSGTANYSTYKTKVGPTGMEGGGAFIEMNMKNAPEGELVGYSIQSNFNVSGPENVEVNESFYSHYDGRLTLAANTIRIQATDQLRIGTFEDRDGFSEMDIKIGGQGNKVNIASIDEQNPTGPLTEVWIGKLGGATSRSTEVSLEGNIYVGNARFPQLDKSSSFTITSLLALMSSGAPAYVLGFFSGASALPYSDVWCMKGGFLGSKDGDVETSNSIMVKELYVVNKDILSITPKVGFFLAKADYSCTQLIGDHRTQVFEGEITLRNNNISSTNIDWALSGANDNVNVVNIGGDSGILIHQGASDEGEPLRIINSCSGSVKISIHDDGTHEYPYPGLEVKPYILDSGNLRTMTRVGYFPGDGIAGSYQFEVHQELGRDGMAVIFTDFFGDAGGNKVNKINANSINTPGTITGIDVVGTNSISAPTATVTSLFISANFSGNTDTQLYKNADNKLMWNGAEVGAGGVSSGGITYMINVASNITNPSPTPTETIITAAYSGNQQRTITQAITSNSAFYIAKYTTEVFDEVSNPVLTGLQQLNQYISWNTQAHAGQLYGQLWFQATATGLATLYQRTYASPVTTTPATVLNGTPIPTPKGLYNINFQRVVFPNINVVVTGGGPVVLRFRVEGLISGTWTHLYSMVGSAVQYTSSANNLTITLDENVTLNQTTPGATALRLVLFIYSSIGPATISQSSAGDNDLAAYSLIGLGVGTPGLFRTMLYDGTNAKITIPHSTTPTLIEYDLAIDAPYNVSAFPSPTLSTDLYFIQPSGGFSNHAVTLYFNEGSISHYHSTISPPQTTPTLAQVLNSGATASQDINMNSHKISGITTLEGAANGNWNVKEITAGTNISVTPTNGSYAITNNAPVQEIAGGTGIQIAKNGTTATVINNAAVQSLTAGTGITIQVDTGTRNAIISNSATAGGQVARDQLSSTSSVGLVPNKLSHYAQDWEAQTVSDLVGDIFVSHDGRTCVYTPDGTNTAYVKYSLDYGLTWANSNLTINKLLHICGSMTGEILYISRIDGSTGQAPNVIFTSSIYVSYNYGVSWSQLTLDRTPEAANTWYNRYIDKIRCSADGSVVMVSVRNTTFASGVPGNGTVYISTNGGASWTIRNITAGPSHIFDCCMSANGAIMFAAANGVMGESTDNGNGGIYRSFDFGETWTKVRNQIAAGSYFFGVIKCDSTGRFLVACDQSQTEPLQGGQVQTSDDFGSSWTWFGDETARGASAAFVSPGGNLMITVHYAVQNSLVRYSTNYGRNWVTAIGFNDVFGLDERLYGASIRALASNHDGSLLLVRSDYQSSSKLYRCVEERGKLELASTSSGLSLTPSFGGGYILSNNPVETLWFSGGFEIQTGNPQFKVDFDWSAAGKIDLNQYNIRYEIDCYWSTGTWSYVYPLLAINDILNTDVQGTSENLSHQELSGLTNWTNNINNGSFGGSEAYTQTYNNRFFAAYFPGSTNNANAGANSLQRQKSIIKGTLSLHRRPLAQTGILDGSENARDILNIFTCDNYSTRFYSSFSYLMNSNAQQGIDYGVNHQRINGTALFAASPIWTYDSAGGGSQLANGIYRLGFHLSEGGTTTIHRPRAAHYTYRIYRVKK